MDHSSRGGSDLASLDHPQATVITTRRIALVILLLVLSVLIILMVTDRPETPQLDLPMNGGIAPAGGITMLATTFSLGGFLVGGGTVCLYAKATDQTIEWRGVPGIGWLLLKIKKEERRQGPPN